MFVFDINVLLLLYVFDIIVFVFYKFNIIDEK